jgi:hypothetical protein
VEDMFSAFPNIGREISRNSHKKAKRVSFCFINLGLNV